MLSGKKIFGTSLINYSTSLILLIESDFRIPLGHLIRKICVRLYVYVTRHLKTSALFGGDQDSRSGGLVTKVSAALAEKKQSPNWSVEMIRLVHL